MSKLPAKLPEITVNLIPQDPFLESMLGKFLLWALSIGRYVVVLTELIVILSFISRFKLDRDLTDLNEAILRQKAVILSYEDAEADFRLTQAKIDFLKQTLKQNTLKQILDSLHQNLPIDVKLAKLSVQPNSWSISAVSMSASGMKSTVDQILKISPDADVSINKVQLDNKTGLINFDLSVNFQQKINKPVEKNKESVSY